MARGSYQTQRGRSSNGRRGPGVGKHLARKARGASALAQTILKDECAQGDMAALSRSLHRNDGVVRGRQRCV